MIEAGQKIYVPTELHLCRGADDFQGGLCTVSAVASGISAGEKVFYVNVKERPNCAYNWDGYLAPMQENLARRYGTQPGRKSPDLSPQFNDDRSGWKEIEEE